jgi:hypothetical protein
VSTAERLRTFDPERPSPYRGPFECCPHEVAFNPDLTDGDVRLYLAVSRHDHETRMGATFSLERIAELWTHERTSLYPSLRRMIADGWLVAETTGSGVYLRIRPAARIDRRYQDAAAAEVDKDRGRRPPKTSPATAGSARLGMREGVTS